MKAETVDVGIDLGTTNSAVAVFENGRAVPLTDDLGSTYIPSCVAFNDRGELLVGRDARQVSLVDPANAVTGFKRYLGSDWSFTFRSGGSRTCEELAALLLQELKRLAETRLNGSVTAAVVTVPAVFGEREKHALLTAAEQAGFALASLVQEPVAAGLAYGWDAKTTSKPYLVYDIGGGTFDAAVVQNIGGQLVVRVHRGEHTLGGRELDQALLRQVVWPAVSHRVSEDEFARRQNELLPSVEDAKIKLSSRETSSIDVAGRLTDLSGRAVDDVVISVSRESFSPLVVPVVSKTIDIVSGLLDEAGIRREDLEGIVLVGGPTKTPMLRQLLEKELAPTPLIASIDPMTVVAQGAALHAGSVRAVTARTGPSETGAVRVRLEFDPVVAGATTLLGIAGDGQRLPDGASFRVKRSDGMWNTGEIAVRDGQALTELALAEDGVSEFSIEAWSPGGDRLAIEPNEFSISKGLAAAPPPLQRSIGIAVDDLMGAEAYRFGYQEIAVRGSPTPLRQKRLFRTTKALGPGRDLGLHVKFYEGESRRPDRNDLLGTLFITGDDISRPVPIDTSVEITLTIDPSKRAEAMVEMPSLGYQNRFAFEIGRHAVMSAEEVQHAARLERLRVQEFASAGIDTGKAETLVADAEQEAEAADSGNQDAPARAKSALKQLAQEMEAMERAAGPVIALADLDAMEQWVDDVVAAFGDEQNKRILASLKQDASVVRRERDANAARDVERQLLLLGQQVYWDQPGAWIAQFQKLAEEQQFTDPEKAAALLQEGRRALEAGDREMLRRVVLDLWDLSESHDESAEARFMLGLRAV